MSRVSSWPPAGGRASSTWAPATRRAAAASRTVATVSRVGVGEAVVRVDRDVQSGDVDGAGVAERDRRHAAVACCPAPRRSAAAAPRPRRSGRWARPASAGRSSAPSGPSSSITPVIGTRPAVGLIAASPQKCAGSRALAPESVPSPHADPPAATIAASPPLLPPGVRSRSYGLFVRPWTGLSVSMPPPHGGQFVFPRRIAPASRSRATAVASRLRHRPRPRGHADRHREAGGLEVVLRRERDAVQRPGGLAAGHGGVRGARLGEGALGSERHDRVERAVDLSDAREMRRDDLLGRRLAAGDDGRQRRGRHAGELGRAHHGAHPIPRSGDPGPGEPRMDTVERRCGYP